jgi:PEP-CTERM/exosortase A-associated glycosyltransferase
VRVLHVLDHSVPLHSGYAFRTLAILREQRALGLETFALTSPRQNASEATSERVDDFEFSRTPYRPGPLARVPALWPIDEMRATEVRLDALVEEISPDVLHAHSPVLDAFPAIRVGRRRGLPVVYEMRASWEDAAVDHGTTRPGSLRYRSSRFAESVALRRADAVTTLCEGLRREIVGRGVAEERVSVVPNGVDVERFSVGGGRDGALARRLGVEGRRVVGFCGSFYAYEGLDLLIDALGEIRSAVPDVALLLVGGGPAEEALRARAARTPLAGSIVFAGRVPHAEVDRYYGLIDCLAFPRWPMRLTELVTPLKPLEAMAQGRVVVASDVGGHRELIRDGETGLLFAAGDRAALARAVVRGLSDSTLRASLAINGRRHVEAERSWRHLVARYLPVYERVVRGAARR